MFKSLSNKALKVKLTQRSMPTLKREKQLTDEAQETHSDKSLIVMSKLFTDRDNPVNLALRMTRELYTYHRTHTLPWEDGGARLLPNTQYFNYTQEIARRRGELDKWVKDHINNYDSYVLSDIAHRAGQNKPRVKVEDYPSADRLKTALNPVILFDPLPNADHFLFDLNAEDKENFESALADRFKDAQNDAIRRIVEPLTKLIQKLEVYSGNAEERFHTSLVTNVIDGAQQTKDLLIDGDAEFLDKVQQVQSFANSLSVDSLKENPTYRDKAKDELLKVQKAMAIFG